MKITKRSPLTGKLNTYEIPITDLQLQRWRHGMKIQDAMPHITKNQREFIMTGYTVEDWHAMWGEGPERDDPND